MATTRKKLLAELNKDLEWEYAAAIQYVQHAVRLSEQFDFHGGVPTVEVEKRDIANALIN